MKYILFSLLIMAVSAGCAVLAERALAGQSDGGDETGEVCEGTGQGYRGPVRVRVRVIGGSITEIEVVDSMEDRFVGGAAIEELIELVLEYNSTDIDAVTGATESSRGFLEAVENAIMKR